MLSLEVQHCPVYDLKVWRHIRGLHQHAPVWIHRPPEVSH